MINVTHMESDNWLQLGKQVNLWFKEMHELLKGNPQLTLHSDEVKYIVQRNGSEFVFFASIRYRVVEKPSAEARGMQS